MSHPPPERATTSGSVIPRMLDSLRALALAEETQADRAKLKGKVAWFGDVGGFDSNQFQEMSNFRSILFHYLDQRLTQALYSGRHPGLEDQRLSKSVFFWPWLDQLHLSHMSAPIRPS